MKTRKPSTQPSSNAMNTGSQRLQNGIAYVLVDNGWKQCGLALVSGMSAGLAPEPVKAWPLMWVALVPVWVMVIAGASHHKATVWKTGLIGACWGLGYYGVILMWITGLHPLMWMGVPWLTSVAIALFAWVTVTGWGMVWSGLWASLLGWITKHLVSSSLSPASQSQSSRLFLLAIIRVLIGTALWCSIDWLWSQGFLYWPSLAFTQSPNNLWILQLGQWSGPTTVTAGIVIVNGFLAEGLVLWSAAARSSLQRSNPEGFNEFKRSSSINTAQKCGAIALGVFLSLHILGGVLFHQPIAVDNQEPLNIGIIQGNIPTRIKLYAEGLRRAIDGYTTGYQKLVEQGVDAVLTPEGALPIFWTPPLSTRTSIFKAVLDHKIPLWLGTFVPNGHDFTQSIITLDAHGETVSQYNKAKLVPLGEYIPFAQILGAIVDRLSPLEAYMIPGTTDQRITTPLGQAIMGICYESAFAEPFRQQAARGGEFLLTASNNDPYNTVMMAQHHALDVMRAIETNRWAVRATNTGYSGVVNPRGQTLWRSQANIYDTHVASIYRRRTQTLYVRYGDWLTPLLIIGAIAASVLQAKRHH